MTYTKHSSRPQRRGSYSGGFRRGPQRGPQRGSFRGGRGRGSSRPAGRGRGRDEHIDFERFINKAIVKKEEDKFVPTHTFNDFAIDAEIKANIAAKGYELPSPIQDKSIPLVLEGKDVVGIAQTGTGKTAAFLIPLIHKVRHQEKSNVLVVVPTRELAVQITKELDGFSKGMKLYSACCVGGTNIRPQMHALKYRNHFVIGTPGRLRDLVQRKAIRLENFDTIVLDEADRMLDMGFIHDMRFLMAGMPEGRQTLFFSATCAREVERLITDFLRDPAYVRVATNRPTSDHIDQDVVRLAGRDKFTVLKGLLAEDNLGKTLIFGRTKHGVEKLAIQLCKEGFKAVSIHGNKTQSNRQKALTAFTKDQVSILVATDVAARGLDIRGVEHVINYELPATHDDYVHRIGRTGRAGNSGKALTFVN